MEPHAFSRPDGFQDFDAAWTRHRDQLEDQLLRCFAGFGYDAITVPSVEYADLYNPRRIGDELYHQLLMARLAEPARFPAGPAVAGPEGRDDLDADGDISYDVVLRPDLTAPVARMVVTGLQSGALDLREPLRLAVSGQVFRNRSPEGGALKELRHVGAELIGDDGALADREVLDLACSGLASLHEGFAEPLARHGELDLRLGHARLPDLLLEALGVEATERPRLQAQLEGFDDYRCRIQRADGRPFARAWPGLRAELRARLRRQGIPAERAHDLLRRLEVEPQGAGSRDALQDAFLADLECRWRQDALVPEAGIAALLRLARLEADVTTIRGALGELLPPGDARASVLAILDELEALSQAPDRSRAVLRRTSVALFMQRGLGYYSGFVFELHAPLPGSLHTRLCGGGRYGDLYDWIYERAGHTQRLRAGDNSKAGSPAAPQSLTSVGLAFGLDRLAEWVSAPRAGMSHPMGVLVVPGSTEDALRAYELAASLRGSCSRVRLARPALGGDASARARIPAGARAAGERFVVVVRAEDLELIDLGQGEGARETRPVTRAELLDALALVAARLEEPQEG